MRRLCGRPGCSGPATATFTFDATRCVVWLNPLSDGTARAGDLCTRHADALAPPQGWERVDRRAPVAIEVPVEVPAASPGRPATPATPRATAPTAPTTASGADSGEGDDLLPARRRRRKRWSEVPTLFESDDGPDARTETPARVETADEPMHPSEPAWLPRYASDVDLDGVLDADTPLLARAFRNVRGGEPDERDDEAR
jgi:hypothetical protein